MKGEFKMKVNSFIEGIRNSFLAPLIGAMLAALTTSIVVGGLYIVNIPKVSDPSFHGLGEVIVANDAESVVLFENTKFDSELFSVKVGDVVSIYEDNGMFTNNPLGHSQTSSSEAEAKVGYIFVLISLVSALLGGFIGFFAVDSVARVRV